MPKDPKAQKDVKAVELDEAALDQAQGAGSGARTPVVINHEEQRAPR